MILAYTERVTIPKAIYSLRKKAGFEQPDLAKILETTVETVSRWENGHQRPTIKTLKKLAAIAGTKGLPELYDVFDKQWKARVAGAVKKLPSAGSPRRVPLLDLKYWSAYLYDTAEKIQALPPTMSAADLREHLRHAAQAMLIVRDEIEIPIAEPPSLTRGDEDAKLLRQPRSTSDQPKQKGKSQ
jgi:transcriptional regulator with XRE-family HTH domain